MTVIVGLETPNNNFRTNIYAGKMFTQLCFFCKCTPNCVYTDLKRSLSNLTLDQCKFDLRSMSKNSKLCQDVNHSTRLDGTRVFILLCDFSGQIGNFHKPYRYSIRFFVIYREKLMASFFDSQFFKFLRIVEEN